MKKTVAVAVLLFASSAFAQTFFNQRVVLDGGVDIYRGSVWVADDGSTVPVWAPPWGTTPGYLEIDGYVYTPYYIFSDSITLIEDDAVLSWPSAYGALGSNPGGDPPSLASIFLYTPYSLHVERTIDAGVVMEKGDRVVVSHTVGGLAIEAVSSVLISGAKSWTFEKAFSSAALSCTCSDTDTPSNGCAVTTKSTTDVTVEGYGNDHFDAICVGPR